MTGSFIIMISITKIVESIIQFDKFNIYLYLILFTNRIYSLSITAHTYFIVEYVEK